MKIYFSGPIKNVPEHLRINFREIANCIRASKHQLLDVDFYNKSLESISRQTKEQTLSVFKKMAKLIKESDLCIFEVTVPSFAVGQEISFALAQSKPIITLYQGDKPHFLNFEGQELILEAKYQPQNIGRTIEEYIDYVKPTTDVRINFYLPKELDNYLVHLSDTLNSPKSVILRRIIKAAVISDEHYVNKNDK